jgi:hypothetical protein
VTQWEIVKASAVNRLGRSLLKLYAVASRRRLVAVLASIIAMRFG